MSKEVLSELLKMGDLSDIDLHVKLEDITDPVTFRSMSGEELFTGLLKDLSNQIDSNFAFGRDLSIIIPVFLIGTTKVTYLQHLVKLVDWTLPTQTYTVIFQDKIHYIHNELENIKEIYSTNYAFAAINEDGDVITLG